MAWLQLILQINGAQAESLEHALMALGAEAITLVDNADQPLLEPSPGATPLWEQARLTALFDAGTDPSQLLTALTRQTAITPFPPYRFEVLEDKDWQREWMDQYHPMQFGSRLWVCPSWQPIPDPQAINLMLDPGLAFGTGTHPTTALCLRWLDQLDLTQKTLIDFGCGSGILGIAGALLGARQVIAIDNDPQALLATRMNAERNGMQQVVSAYCPATAPELAADFLVANILAGPLLELADKMWHRLKPGGRLALSGILAGQQEALIEKYAQGFTITGTQQEEEWVRIDAIKR